MPRKLGPSAVAERIRNNKISERVEAVNGVVVPSKVPTGQRPARPVDTAQRRGPEAPKVCNICGKIYSQIGHVWLHFPDCVDLNGNPHGVRWDDGIDTSGWKPRAGRTYDPSLAADSDTRRRRPTIKEQLNEVNGVVTPSKVAPGANPVQEAWDPEASNLVFQCPICEMRLHGKVALWQHFLRCVNTNGNPRGLSCNEEWEAKCKEDYARERSQARRSKRTLRPKRATTTPSTHQGSLELVSEAGEQDNRGDNRRQRRGRGRKRRRVEVPEVPEAERSINPPVPVLDAPDPISDDIWARSFNSFRSKPPMPNTQWVDHEGFLGSFPTREVQADENEGLQSSLPTSKAQAQARSQSNHSRANNAIIPRHNPRTKPVYSHDQSRSAYGPDMPHETRNPMSGRNLLIDPTYDHNQDYHPYNTSSRGAREFSLPIRNTPHSNTNYFDPRLSSFHNPAGPSHQVTAGQPTFHSSHNVAPPSNQGTLKSAPNLSYSIPYDYSQDPYASNIRSYGASGASLPIRTAPHENFSHRNLQANALATPAGPPRQATVTQPAIRSANDMFLHPDTDVRTTTSRPSYYTTYNYDQTYNASNRGSYGERRFPLPTHNVPHNNPTSYNPPRIPVNIPAGPFSQNTASQPPSNDAIPPQSQTAPDTRHPSHPLSEEDPIGDINFDDILGSGVENLGNWPSLEDLNAPSIDAEPDNFTGSSFPTLRNDPAIDARLEEFLGPGWQTFGNESYTQIPTIDNQPNDLLGSSFQTLSNEPAPQHADTSLPSFDNVYDDQYTYLENEFFSASGSAYGGQDAKP